jgi:hypothetical protein
VLFLLVFQSLFLLFLFLFAWFWVAASVALRGRIIIALRQGEGAYQSIDRLVNGIGMGSWAL